MCGETSGSVQEVTRRVTLQGYPYWSWLLRGASLSLGVLISETKHKIHACALAISMNACCICAQHQGRRSHFDDVLTSSECPAAHFATVAASRLKLSLSSGPGVTRCTGAKGPISLNHRACEETCLAGVQAHFDVALGRACRVKRTRYIAHKTKRRVHAAGRQLSNAYTQGYATVS